MHTRDMQSALSIIISGGVANHSGLTTGQVDSHIRLISAGMRTFFADEKRGIMKSDGMIYKLSGQL